jgi:hypothetical protein
MYVNTSIKRKKTTKRGKVEVEEQIQEIPNSQLLAAVRIKEEVNIM